MSFRSLVSRLIIWLVTISRQMSVRSLVSRLNVRSGTCQTANCPITYLSVRSVTYQSAKWPIGYLSVGELFWLVIISRQMSVRSFVSRLIICLAIISWLNVRSVICHRVNAHLVIWQSARFLHGHLSSLLNACLLGHLSVSYISVRSFIMSAKCPFGHFSVG